MKWAAMKGVVYAYGMNASEGTGRVTMNDARLPTAIEPSSLPSPMAAAPLRVVATRASRGVSFILMHASAITMRISPDGDDPGL